MNKRQVNKQDMSCLTFLYFWVVPSKAVLQLMWKGSIDRLFFYWETASSTYFCGFKIMNKTLDCFYNLISVFNRYDSFQRVTASRKDLGERIRKIRSIRLIKKYDVTFNMKEFLATAHYIYIQSHKCIER